MAILRGMVEVREGGLSLAPLEKREEVLLMAEQVVVVVAAEAMVLIKTLPVAPVGAIRNIKEVAAQPVLWVRQVVRELSVKAAVAAGVR